MKRRSLLKTSLVLASGLLSPGMALAVYPKAAFDAKDVPNAVTGAFGSNETSLTDQITIKAPGIAENGTVVPVWVRSNIVDTESISIVVDGNDNPFVATYILHGSEALVSTRIKMAKTSELMVVVKASGVLHAAKKEIKVTIGGCGD